VDFSLPKFLQDQIVIYEDFHINVVNSNHKLEWIWNQGSVVLNYSFPDKQKKKMQRFELTVSVVQASVLLLFNENNTYVYKVMRDRILNITDPSFKSMIGPLLFNNMRLLTNRGADGKGKQKVEGKVSMDLGDDDMISLIPLNAKKKRITYPARLKSLESKLEDSSKIKEKTQEERGFRIEAAIVRVMKSRNVMNQQELIAESTKQLTKYFKPNVRIVKKRIESLMEREYLKRDENDHRIIHYLA